MVLLVCCARLVLCAVDDGEVIDDGEAPLTTRFQQALDELRHKITLQCSLRSDLQAYAELMVGSSLENLSFKMLRFQLTTRLRQAPSRCRIWRRLIAKMLD
jgi:hypothetical protein